MSSVPWASYFRADYLILYHLVSFLCRPYTSPSVHRFGELFFCRPSLGRVIFVPTIQLCYQSIPLASYFCVIHPLGRVIPVPTIDELFSCHSFNSPPIHPFGELFLYCPTLGRVIFILTVCFSVLWQVILMLTI